MLRNSTRRSTGLAPTLNHAVVTTETSSSTTTTMPETSNNNKDTVSSKSTLVTEPPNTSSKRVSGRLANLQNLTSSGSTASTSTVVTNSVSITSSFSTESGLSGEPTEDSAQRRRISSRSIKRKKFDDELVDSLSTSYPKVNKPSTKSDNDGDSTTVETVDTPSTPGMIITNEPVSVANSSKKTKTVAVASNSSTAPPSSKKSKSRSKTSTSALTSVKYEESHYWKPSDDLALIINVEQTNDLTKVFQGVKFSCKFTLAEIEARWHSLLYNVNIKSLSLAAIRQLHPDMVNLIQSKALFSEAEEALVKNIESRDPDPPKLEVFEELLTTNPEIFLPSRTPKLLLKHWMLLRQYNLLAQQNIQTPPRLQNVVCFSEIEKIVRKEVQEELKNTSNLAVNSNNLAARELMNQEITHSIRKSMLEIRMLENEVPKYRTLLDSMTGISHCDFDNETYAVLRGRMVRYLMRSMEITIGRSTKDFAVDVNLSLEGFATKCSRLHAIISLQPTGEFIMYNTGKRPIYVDSQPLLRDTSLRVNNNSLIEISSLRFIFLINLDLISSMRNEVLQKSITTT